MEKRNKLMEEEGVMSANKAIRRLNRRIQELKATVLGLQQQIDWNENQNAETEHYANVRLHEVKESARREYIRIEEDARHDREAAETREWERRLIARNLERAVDWQRITGRDPFGDIERCIRRLARF